MAKYTWSIAGKDDKIFTEGFTISNTKPRYRIGSKETADKFNKGGAQVIPIESKKDKVNESIFVLGTQEEARRINGGGVSVISLSGKKNKKS